MRDHDVPGLVDKTGGLRPFFPDGFSEDCLLYYGQVNIPVCVDKADQWQNHSLKRLKKFWQKRKVN